MKLTAGAKGVSRVRWHVYSILGLYWDNGKYNGNFYDGLYGDIIQFRCCDRGIQVMQTDTYIYI